MKRYIDAIIFDLDGVITDTAEYHFRAWKRLADEEGIPFTRKDNEKLRGVSRRESLQRLLGDRKISDDQTQEWMTRKNEYYQEMILSLSPSDLLPGAISLLTELRDEGFKVAIASASRNAPDVIARLGIRELLDTCVDGGSVQHQKPEPDLFLHAANLLDTPPARCIVIEDAAAGIQAAHAAGMVAIGLGSPERVGSAELILPDLDGVSVADLTYATTWRVSEARFEPNHQHQFETVFTQGNGYLGTRGTFEERFPEDTQATLVHGMWGDAPVGFTELVNAPDWAACEIFVNGQRFSMDQGRVTDYARYLDLRTGILHRRLRWTTQDEHGAIELHYARFPSLADPHVLVSRVRIRPVGRSANVEIRTVLNAQVENEGRLQWLLENEKADEVSTVLLAIIRGTKKQLAMVSTIATVDAPVQVIGRDCPGMAGQEIKTELKAGQTLVVDKFVAVYTSRDTEDPLGVAQEKAAQAKKSGYDALFNENHKAWSDFWANSDVIIEGDDEAQLAIRHALFQLRIAASATDERVSIGAKTLSGFGYRGHVFWDNEIFVLPFFTYTQPHLARNMLMYRWHTIEGARRKAAEHGCEGAHFAWESAETGDEVTPRWGQDAANSKEIVRIWAGDIQIHITADVASAIWRYWKATGDDDFMRAVGAPIILESALFWEHRVESENGRFSIRQVIGPDEYHDHIDNNAFTNGMVKWHLETALEAKKWLEESSPEDANKLFQRLGLTEKNFNRWQNIMENLVFLHDPQTGLIEQFEGFFQLPEVDWEKFAGRTESIQALLGIEGANQHQVLKQPDMIMLLCLLPDHFDRKTLQANWDYYNPRTDHSYGSSLGPAIHALAACKLVEPEIAYEHFMRAARVDLDDIRGNTRDGIHAASAGGLWQALIFGFAGLHHKGSEYTLNPCMPSHWRRLAFRIQLQGTWHDIDVRSNGCET